MLVAEEAVEIRVLRRQGKSIRKIARLLNLSRNTVRRYLRNDGLPHYQREPSPSKLDRYKQYLAKRVKAAAPDWIPATVLLHELKALGYSGEYSILKEHLATLRPTAKPDPLVRFETEPGRQMQADFGTIRKGTRPAVGVHRDARLEPGDLRRVRDRRAAGDVARLS
jgi:transposase